MVQIELEIIHRCNRHNVKAILRQKDTNIQVHPRIEDTRHSKTLIPIHHPHIMEVDLLKRVQDTNIVQGKEQCIHAAMQLRERAE